MIRDPFTDFLHHTGEFTDKAPKISIIQGDITKIKADAIVNAANSSLFGGGGVDGAIHKAAGPNLLKECKLIRKKYYPEGLPIGKSVATKAYNLKAKIVIHTVGPVYGKKYIIDGAEKDYIALLKECYTNCLKIADSYTPLIANDKKSEDEDYNCYTIAFPAISTGAYCVPIEKSAMIVEEVLSNFKSRDIREILLVLFTKNNYNIYKKAFRTEGEEKNE